MYRTHNCGELSKKNVGQTVTLSGWVQIVRDKGGMVWIDIRDKFGITQLALEDGVSSPSVLQIAKGLGREYVITVKGQVIERVSKSSKISTGDIEIKVSEIKVLNKALTPPFKIEDETDGGDELRMKYRYLDIRRTPVRKNLELRNKVSFETRNYFDL